MLEAIFGCVLGILIGLCAAVPGLHPSVLLVGLLGLLGISGILGATVLAGAVGSGLAAVVLAKTFHPATQETLNSATPEVVMAYKGRGLKAVLIQLQACWTGIIVVLLLAFPFFLINGFSPELSEAALNILKPISPLLILGFLIATWAQAHAKLVTGFVMVTGTFLGFYVLNHPAMVGNQASLGPLLGGIFSIPILVMVLTHQGKVVGFPSQQAPTMHRVTSDKHVWGALGGIVTALTAGLGSSAAVSLFADVTHEEEYLGMSTAAEAANNSFAILAAILVGSAHSGSAVALKRALPAIGPITGLLLLVTILIGLAVGTVVVQKILPQYVKLVGRFPQKRVALAVLVLTVGLIGLETGVFGLVAAAAAGCLGYLARTHMVPNQALVTVLTGPVLIYYSGTSELFARMFGIMH